MDVKQANAKEFGPEIPEAVKNWFASQEERFSSPVSVSFDTARIIKSSKTGISEADAEQLAFLLFRARTVLRYHALPGVERTLGWSEALDHAWLRTELMKLCMERRKRSIAEREARKARLETLIMTGQDEVVTTAA